MDTIIKIVEIIVIVLSSLLAAFTQKSHKETVKEAEELLSPLYIESTPQVDSKTFYFDSDTTNMTFTLRRK